MYRRYLLYLINLNNFLVFNKFQYLIIFYLKCSEQLEFLLYSVYTSLLALVTYHNCVVHYRIMYFCLKKFVADTALLLCDNMYTLIQANRFLVAISQLCHSNTDLAYATWVSLFSKIWSILTDRQRQVVLLHIVLHQCIQTDVLQTLSNEMSPFLCSGSHLVQSDCHPSAISAFVEGIMLCEPKLHIRSCVWKVSSLIIWAWKAVWNGGLCICETSPFQMLQDKEYYTGFLNQSTISTYGIILLPVILVLIVKIF